MKTNEGTVDRVLRVILGIILLYLGFGGVWAGTLMWVARIFGVLLTLTGLTGFCGIYKLLGIRTNGSK